MTGQIILIEGVDGTGKTTLARELAARAGTRSALFHAGPPQNTAYLNEYIMPLIIASDGWTIICDRWHLGEPVWAKLFKRKPILTVEQLHIVEKRLQALDVQISPIYLERDEKELVCELEIRGETREQIDTTLAAVQEYEHAMRFSMFYWHRTTLLEALDDLKGDE